MEYAIILAGGRGERFWPISRKDNPKQLLSIFTAKTLLEETIDRAKLLVESDRIKIVASNDIKKRIQRKLPWITDDYFIVEPYGRNTAAAIGLAAKMLVENDPEALMYVLPSDHIIKDTERFLCALLTAKELAEDEDERLVLVGIKPTRPETGYGYIELEPLVHNNIKCSMCYRVVTFKEKPSRPLAQEFILDKKHYWNSGMFIWKAKTILNYIKELMPELYSVLSQYGTGKFKRAYKELKSVSIDYGILEKAGKVFVVLGDFFWDDIGSWSSLERIMEKDSNDNVKIGSALTLECHNSTIINDGKGLIAIYGVSDLVIAKSKNRVIVLHKSKIDDIRNLVERLKEDRKWLRFL